MQGKPKSNELATIDQTIQSRIFTIRNVQVMIDGDFKRRKAESVWPTQKIPCIQEQGVSMLSAVLRSEVAVKISVRIMDAPINGAA